MKYGLARNLDIYCPETGDSETLLALSGDYVRAQLWASKELKGADPDLKDIEATFAWAYFTIDRNGLREKYGLPDKLTKDNIADAMNAVTTFFGIPEDDSLPLVSEKQRTKSQK